MSESENNGIEAQPKVKPDPAIERQTSGAEDNDKKQTEADDAQSKARDGQTDKVKPQGAVEQTPKPSEQGKDQKKTEINKPVEKQGKDKKTATTAEWIEYLICDVAIMILIFGLAIASIVIGAMNLKNCEMNKWIPRFLLVNGILWLSYLILYGITTLVVSKKNEKRRNFLRSQGLYATEENADIDVDAPSTGRLAKEVFWVTGCLSLVIWGWNIAASVFVFGQYASYKASTYEQKIADCDPVTYWFAFSFIIFFYSVMALLTLVACTSCCFCCKAKKKQSGQSE